MPSLAPRPGIFPRRGVLIAETEGGIRIESPNSSRMRLYDITGRSIAISSGVKTHIHAGMYFLRLDSEVLPVMVR
jgi:hypothetical protein